VAWVEVRLAAALGKVEQGEAVVEQLAEDHALAQSRLQVEAHAPGQLGKIRTGAISGAWKKL
jgi:hypothetical protein